MHYFLIHAHYRLLIFNFPFSIFNYKNLIPFHNNRPFFEYVFYVTLLLFVGI